MSLLLALMAVTATCQPNPSAAGAAPPRVRAYFAAINARDEAAIGAFLMPGATYESPRGQLMLLAEVMTSLVATPEAERLDVTEATARGGGVFVRTRTPSGSEASAAVRFEGGCLAEFVQTS